LQHNQKLNSKNSVVAGKEAGMSWCDSRHEVGTHEPVAGRWQQACMCMSIVNGDNQ